MIDFQIINDFFYEKIFNTTNYKFIKFLIK
jgi:hypothetical protein